MEKVALKVEKRADGGKGNARSLRRAGSIPAVIYGQGSSTPITINRKEFVRILNTGGGTHTLLAVTVEGAGGGEKLAIIKDYQTDPIKNELLHADLLEVAADKLMHVTVPVVLTGETPKGVKEGGILQTVTREVMVECLPGDMPEQVLLDGSDLGIGSSVHVGDLSLPKGVKVLTEPEKVVLTITAPISAEKLEAMLSTEVAAEVKEPEVLTKVKEKEAEGGK